MTTINTDGFYEMLAIKATKWTVEYNTEGVKLMIALPEVVINKMELLANDVHLEFFINDVLAFTFKANNSEVDYRKATALRQLDVISVSIPYNEYTEIEIV